MISNTLIKILKYIYANQKNLKKQILLYIKDILNVT